MKKRTINAFTLVEMLIVIVIIGILIAALMPRMQAAQGRARDVSRKTALSQIQSAIVVSQGDKGAWPGMPKNNAGVPAGQSATGGLDVISIKTQLESAGMNGVPQDPLNAVVEGLGASGSGGQFRYMVLARNGTPAGGFVLMAKTEVEGGSNWVYCKTGSTEPTNLTGGKITTTDDLKNVVPCTSVSKKTSSESCGKQTDGSCRYEADGQLRYIVTY